PNRSSKSAPTPTTASTARSPRTTCAHHTPPIARLHHLIAADPLMRGTRRKPSRWFTPGRVRENSVDGRLVLVDRWRWFHRPSFRVPPPPRVFRLHARVEPDRLREARAAHEVL